MKKPTKLPATATTPMLDGAAAKALAAEGDALRRAMRKRIRKMWTISDEERQVRCQ